MDKTEFIILKNLLCNEKYSRKVLPFIKDEYFEDLNQKIIFVSDSKVFEILLLGNIINLQLKKFF